MNPSRKRKRSSIANGVSKNESTPKRAKTEMSYKAKKRKSQLTCEGSSARIANFREIKIILDRTIVAKYFRAKQMLREILSPADPKHLRPKNDKKPKQGKKQTSLLDYLQVKNDPLTSLSPKNIETDSSICQNVSIKKEPPEQTADIDQNNTATIDVNTPRIVYYAGSDQSNCFFYNDKLVVMPVDAQFTPEEFVYNNCGFVSVMGVPIKTELPEKSIVIDELDEKDSNHEYTMSDVMSIDEIATTSTPMIKTTTFIEQKIKPETKQPMAKFDEHGFPVCPKCDRSFRILESFKQHILLCGLEFLYECSYCTYKTKFTHAMKKHVERNHKNEIEEEGLENILKKIRNTRTNNKNLSLMSKEAEYDSEAEESVIKSIENIKFKHSKLKFDLSCPKCEKVFKRVRGIPMKTCPDCTVTLEFRCQKCGKFFSQYRKIYRHAITCGIVKPKIRPNVFLRCEHCAFRTYYKAAIRQHIFHRHMKNDESTVFQCKICSFESLYEHNLKRHKRDVHGVDESFSLMVESYYTTQTCHEYFK